MKKVLHFVCPTDCMEPILDEHFQNENYYFSSLGISTSLDDENLSELVELIIKRDIRDVHFVLADDNSILKDAIRKQSYSDIRGLRAFYSDIYKKKEQAETFWNASSNLILLISYHLNTQIKKLNEALEEVGTSNIKLDGMIYRRKVMTFQNIYSELICMDVSTLN